MNRWIRWEENTPSTETVWRWLADAMAMPALLVTPERPAAAMSLQPSRLAGKSRQKFVALLGPERLRLEDSVRARHACGSSAVDQLRLRAGEHSHAPDAVLYPRDRNDVLGLLKIAADDGIAVVPFGCGRGPGVTPLRGPHAAIVTLNMSAMGHLLSLDVISGLAEVEAGITGTELARQLSAHGMAAEPIGEASLGGFIAQNPHPSWLVAVTLATPKGKLTPTLPQLASMSQGVFGVITSATIRIHSLAAKSEYRRYLFADFASGLVAVRQAQRQGLCRHALLSDAAATRFQCQMEQVDRGWSLSHWLKDIHRSLRHFDRQAAALIVGFSGSEAECDCARKHFDLLTRRLGALALGPCEAEPADPRQGLLDHGAALDVVQTTASWSQLPVLYTGLRNALDQAMRAHAPRAGAHGLVLGRVTNPQHDGANLCLAYVFPRLLGKDVAQAQAIRQAACQTLGSLVGKQDGLEREIMSAVKKSLDPTGILNPGKLAF
jgi:alkyldihydroxyacetonephosphate synthase